MGAFPDLPRYLHVNWPGISDEEILRMIGCDIASHLQVHGGRVMGKTWEERFPAFVDWLKRKGKSAQDAVEAYESWSAERLNEFATAEPVGRARVDGTRLVVELVRSLPKLSDVLAAENRAAGVDPTQLVKLDQIAAFARRSKRTVQLWQRRDKDFPPPAVEGGGGKAALWHWPDIVEYLRRKTGIASLPDRFPALKR